jgi:SAM-dependent methyltransferase
VEGGRVTDGPAPDQRTADRFAASWNSVWDASVYTREQFLDWIAPWDAETVRGRSVLELGCGSGALLVHFAALAPARLVGVDLGGSVARARALLGPAAEVVQADLTDTDGLVARLGRFDRVYSIGVLHHLREPERGVASLLAMTRPGGSFHGWVYAHEGNAVVRWIVDPVRVVASRLPWRVTKYAVALPLAVPFFAASKTCAAIARAGVRPPLPLRDYLLWIARRGFRFHHHVAFDQLVTPVTSYIRRERVERWLADPRVEPGSAYVVLRNGNGWKFGGRIRAEETP